MYFYCATCWRRVHDQHADLAHHAAFSRCSEFGEVIFLRESPNEWQDKEIKTFWFAPDSLQLVQERYGNPLLGEQTTVIDSRMRKLTSRILENDVIASLARIRSERETELPALSTNNSDKIREKKIIDQINNAMVLGENLQRAILNGEVSCIMCMDNLEDDFHLFLSVNYTTCNKNRYFHAFCKTCYDDLINTPADPRKDDYRSSFISTRCTMCLSTSGMYQRIQGGQNNPNK